ncbi:hypothetical protein PHLGIDRAFT_367399 [Phlebiopsis gigantea 11061_1 CR5-6]|uniref:Uncharacterized protein n=1 Tax=Phlebiopsis gigantea (strain 11061_1 CR5-6) TaxID=745531 RepID=A0A0C3NA16_PHLG1|nr:hypothetical protein PHLGIDRAFT_367399 [Phlebiopsis gigantea 11061_1 CR5-6]
MFGSRVQRVNSDEKRLSASRPHLLGTRVQIPFRPHQAHRRGVGGIAWLCVLLSHQVLSYQTASGIADGLILTATRFCAPTYDTIPS